MAQIIKLYKDNGEGKTLSYPISTSNAIFNPDTNESVQSELDRTLKIIDLDSSGTGDMSEIDYGCFVRYNNLVYQIHTMIPETSVVWCQGSILVDNNSYNILSKQLEITIDISLTGDIKLAEYSCVVTELSSEIPTKTSQLTNDSNFISLTDSDEVYVKKSETSVSPLGDSIVKRHPDGGIEINYIYGSDDGLAYALPNATEMVAGGADVLIASKDDIPTKTSLLENDSEYLSGQISQSVDGNSIVLRLLDGSIMVDLLTADGSGSVYALSESSHAGDADFILANRDDIPTKVSQLDNDLEFITQSQVPEETYVLKINSYEDGYTFTISEEEMNKLYSAKTILLLAADAYTNIVSFYPIGVDVAYIYATIVLDTLNLGYEIFVECALSDNGWDAKVNTKDYNKVYYGDIYYKGLPTDSYTTSTSVYCSYNTAYIWKGSGPSSITALLPTLSLYSYDNSGGTEEILLEFSVPDASFSLTFTGGSVVWANGEYPIFDVGGTYLIHLTARHTTSGTNDIVWLGICSNKFDVTYS